MSRIVVKNASTGTELIWRHIVIKKSLDDICHTLELEIAPSERGKVQRHNKIEVRYANGAIKDSQAQGGRRVTTVLVDEITGSVDSHTHGIMVRGRSPARDIIDSTWSEDFAEMTLLELTRAIGKRFGIKCDIIPTTGDTTQKVNAFRLENESPWVKLISEADNQGFVFTSNEAGDLYLWEVAGVVRDEGFRLVEGVNVKTISWIENGSEQFHEYIIQGCGESAKVIDDTCPGGRVFTINITDPDFPQAKLQRRAETEMRRRKKTSVMGTVSGWGLSDVQIERLGSVTAGKEVFWVPNLLIPVIAPSIGLDAKLLISNVEYEAYPNSFGCGVTVVNKDAYI